MIYLLWFLVIFLPFFYLFMFIKLIEYVYTTRVLNQVPMVSCGRGEGKILAKYINKYYKDAKYICDFGSGYGALSRIIAKNTSGHVYGVENMPFSIFVSRFLRPFCRGKLTYVWDNVFKFMDKTDIVFDIAVLYFGPMNIKSFVKYKNKIRVLISLDFEISGIKPTRVINGGRGYTLFNHKKYPHKIFIYKLK